MGCRLCQNSLFYELVWLCWYLEHLLVFMTITYWYLQFMLVFTMYAVKSWEYYIKEIFAIAQRTFQLIYNQMIFTMIPD